MGISITKRDRQGGGLGGRRKGASYTAQVRYRDVSVSATFDAKLDAQAWSARVLSAAKRAAALGLDFDQTPFKTVDRRKKREVVSFASAEERAAYIDAIGEPTPPAAEANPDDDPMPRPDWTVKRALAHYRDTVTDKRKGVRQETARIEAWRADPLSAHRLTDLTAEHLHAWVQGRRKRRKVKEGEGSAATWVFRDFAVAATTIRNDVFRLSALFNHAAAPVTRGGWGLTGLVNPASAVHLPAPARGRQRRFNHDDTGGELDRLLVALGDGLDGVEMVDIVRCAIETGMRRSEILDLRSGEIRSTPAGRVIERKDSKNGEPRRVILSEEATEIVDRRRRPNHPGDRLFNLNADAVASRWNRARITAGCPDIRFHDLRHEALSQMADAGLSLGALMAQSGHRTAQTAARYINASERDIREKLSQRKR